MRWTVGAEPEPWEIRWVTKFAWLPKRVGDTMVWLGRYRQKQFWGPESGAYIDITRPSCGEIYRGLIG